jgi:hypothetical protein
MTALFLFVAAGGGPQNLAKVKETRQSATGFVGAG